MMTGSFFRYNGAMMISASGRKADVVLPVTAFILPPLGVLAPLGAAPLLIVAAIAALAVDGRRIWARLGATATLIGLLAALAAWGTLSALWSIIPEHSAFEGVRFLGVSACGIVLLSEGENAEGAERTVAYALLAGAILALALLAIERFGGEPIRHWWLGVPPSHYEPLAHYDRGMTILVLLMAPIAVSESAGWLRMVFIATIVGMAAVMTSAASLLAAIVGLAVFGVAHWAPRFAAAGMIAGIVALGIAIPVATPSYSTVLTLHERAPWIKWSGIHRLLIWRFVADRVAERPLLGWGMDSSRAIPGGKTNFNTVLPTLHYPGGAQRLPLHPHDAALQWQLELGVPGLLLGLTIVAWVLYAIGWRARFSEHERAVALGLAAAALVIGLLSFGIWQSWWLSTLWLVASVYAACRGPESAPAQRRAHHHPH